MPYGAGGTLALIATYKEIVVLNQLQPRARVSMIIDAAPADIVAAFVMPDKLAAFWLASASAPLSVGSTVHWNFLVPGAAAATTATRITPEQGLAWRWDDGTRVDIGLERLADGGTAVTLVNDGFQGSAEDMLAAALDASEGFALVLASLKLLLETGTAGNIVRDKARLIALRR